MEPYQPARLGQEKLEKLQELEKEWGVVLVAYKMEVPLPSHVEGRNRRTTV